MLGILITEIFYVVPVVQKTWAKETGSLEYLSETEDTSIPTIKLNVVNTERGNLLYEISSGFRVFRLDFISCPLSEFSSALQL